MKNKKKRFSVSVLFVLAAILGGMAVGLVSHDRAANAAYRLIHERHVTL